MYNIKIIHYPGAGTMIYIYPIFDIENRNGILAVEEVVLYHEYPANA